MSNAPKVVFSLQNSAGENIIWATDDGKWHAPYGFEGPGQGSELPPDVMSTNVYDTDKNGIVDLAQALVPEAKVDWNQLVNVPDLTMSWSNIIDIPDTLVHQPDLDLVVQAVNSQFQIRDDAISSKVSTQDFQLSISNINSEINSVKESKRDYFNSVDYYTSDKAKSKLISWYYQGSPSSSTDPTVKWTTNSVRDQHLGDFYYDVLEGRLYTYTKTDGTYSWKEYSTQSAEGVVDALVVHKIASETIDTIEDNYRASYRNTPTVPYYRGDLWMDGDTLRIAAYTRESGDFYLHDWSVATDTYDPSELEALVDELYSQVSTMYDKSNKLDTSWIWSIRSGATLSRDIMSLYSHTPEVRSNPTSYSTVLDGSTPFLNSTDRLLKLTSSSVVEDGFNFGIRFGNSDVPSTLVRVDNDYNYRLSFWMKATTVQDLRVVVDDYNESGVEDTSNNAHRNKPLSYVNAGTNQWVLGVMYLVTKDDDLSDSAFRTQLYNLDGVNIANLSSDLTPIKYSQDNLRLSIQSSVQSSTEMEIYSIRLDELNPNIPYPTIQELVTNRVKRSGVVEELRGYVSNVEHLVADDRIVNIVTRSDVFASKFPTVINTDKPSISWSAPTIREFTQSSAQQFLDSVSFDLMHDTGINPSSVTLSEVSYKNFTRGTSDELSIVTTRSDREVLSTLSFSITTEVEIISSSPSIPSKVVTLTDVQYLNPSGVVTNPSFNSSEEYLPGKIQLSLGSNTKVLDKVSYQDSSGNNVLLRYSYYSNIVATSELIPYSLLLPINLSSSNEDGSPMITLVTTNGTSMTVVEDEHGNEVEVTPELLSIEAYLYNTNIKHWQIRFQDSTEWITIDTSKFITSDYGILPINTSTQVPAPLQVGVKTLLIDANIRYLLADNLKSSSWNSSVPIEDMTNYSKWYFRVVDDLDQTSSLVVDISPDLGEIVKSLRTVTAQLVITTDSISQSITSLESFRTTTTNTLTQINASLEGINLEVSTIKITRPHVAYSMYADGTNFSLEPQENSQYMGIAITITELPPEDKEQYKWSRYVGPEGPMGESPYDLRIISTNGNIFKNGSIGTYLIAKVYKGQEDVTDQFSASQFIWTRSSHDPASDNLWNIYYSGGTKEIEITSEDVHHRASFTCDLKEQL